MGRKNLLIDLDEDQLTAVNTPSPAQPEPREKVPQPTLGVRGAVGAMSRSLEMISAERVAAKALSESIASGQNVLEINATLIDASIVPDRMMGDESDHAALVESIRTEGQLVPVLLRPHPTSEGRYQVAYGHRRVRALTALERPVRAVVRHLSDDELVVAQGKENSDRKDLSYIERGRFAATLEDRKFGRETIMAALNVDKTELSRMISVIRAMPPKIVESVGPAPKTGRRRWMELAERLAARGSDKRAADVMESEKFHVPNSDDRFAVLFTALAPRKSKSPRPVIWSSGNGRKIARVTSTESSFLLAIDKRVAPEFGDYLLTRMERLYEEYENHRKGD
jgi:ParB family transcriptional regulator, chromosome partitioning protein